jgi:hypothetical protein
LPERRQPARHLGACASATCCGRFGAAQSEGNARRAGKKAPGLDLGKRESQIALLTEDGELINLRIRTERQRLVEMFGRRP